MFSNSLISDDVQLVGVKQYVTIVYEDGAKTLVSMLNRIQYDLVMVFANHHDELVFIVASLYLNRFHWLFIAWHSSNYALKSFLFRHGKMTTTPTMKICGEDLFRLFDH